jgi:hypothetical protein
MAPKTKLHAMIDACNDDNLIQQAIEIFNQAKDDWWEKLTEDDQQKTLAALDELDKNKGINHSSVMQKAWSILKQ